MTVLVVKHKVRDLGVWKSVFERASRCIVVARRRTAASALLLVDLSDSDGLHPPPPGAARAAAPDRATHEGMGAGRPNT